jgi:CRP-like cAMP-binding protein
VLSEPGHSHDCRNCAIRRGWLFTQLDDAEVEKLVVLSRPLRFSRRQILFSAGTESTHMYLVTQGVVKLLRVSPNGRSQVLRLAYPGDLAGTEGFFRSHHEMSAEALTAGSACVIPRDRLMRTLRTYPEFALHLLEAMHEELDQAREQIQEMGKTSAESKICSLLCDLLPHLTAECEETAEFPLAHQDLADILGLSRETISRVVGEMARRGVFSLRRQRVRVHDHAQLRELAG